MRVNHISPATYYTRAQLKTPKTTNPVAVSHRGLQGAVGSIAGTAAGIGLGLLTGGIGTILIAAMTGCGLGGAIGSSADNDVNDESIDVPSYSFD